MKKPSKPDVRKIVRDVSEQSAPADSSISDELKAGLDRVELLAEKLGQALQFTDALEGYINESRSELEHLRWYRIAAVLASGAAILFFFYLLCQLIFGHQLWFFMLGQYTRAALIFSTLAGSVLLLTVILKGVFRSSAERSKDEVLPSHLREMVEVARKLPTTDN